MASPRSRRAVPVREPLRELLRGLGMEGRLVEVEIQRTWTHAVGRSAAQYARPVRLEGGRLLVHVANSVWLHKLSLVRRDILQNVNDHLATPAVKEVRLRIGAVTDETATRQGTQASARTPRSAARRLPHTDPDDPALQEAMKLIKDLSFGDAVDRILRKHAALTRGS